MDRQQIFGEFNEHLITDNCPSAFFREVASSGWLERDYPFTFLGQLQSIQQSPEFHPEGNVWEHTMLVVDQAAKARYMSDNPRVFMWAALLHDLGKITTTKIRRGRITAYDHDRDGAQLAADFLQELCDDQVFIHGVTKLIRWHMQPLYVNKRLPFADIDKMLSDISLHEIALFSLCDRLGRGNMSYSMRMTELDNMESFIKECERIEN